MSQCTNLYRWSSLPRKPPWHDVRASPQGGGGTEIFESRIRRISHHPTGDEEVAFNATHQGVGGGNTMHVSLRCSPLDPRSCDSKLRRPRTACRPATSPAPDMSCSIARPRIAPTADLRMKSSPIEEAGGHLRSPCAADIEHDTIPFPSLHLVSNLRLTPW